MLPRTLPCYLNDFQTCKEFLAHFVLCFVVIVLRSLFQEIHFLGVFLQRSCSALLLLSVSLLSSSSRELRNNVLLILANCSLLPAELPLSLSLRDVSRVHIPPHLPTDISGFRVLLLTVIVYVGHTIAQFCGYMIAQVQQDLGWMLDLAGEPCVFL